MRRAVNQGRLVAVALLALAACAKQIVPHAGPPNEHPFFRGLRTPLVIAHRGGAGLWPENTMVAFRGALALGADVIELDLQETADQELVVLHDTTVQRTTDGVGMISTLRRRDLQMLDAGYSFSPDGGRTYPYRGRGVVIPTFIEVLTALPEARLLVEIKPADDDVAIYVCQLLRALEATERVMVSSMQTGVIETFRHGCPEVATGATPKEVTLFTSARALRVVELPEIAAVAFQIPERWRGVPVLTPRVLQAAHERRLQVHVWTIDDPADMRRLLAMGVDGLVTDRPDALMKILGRPPAGGLVRAGGPWYAATWTGS